MNTSATGGALQTVNSTVEGLVYESLVKQFLMDLTGFTDKHVVAERCLAENDATGRLGEWLSFFMLNRVASDSPYMKNISESEVLIQRDFTDVWRITFYGESHGMNSERFEDAVFVYQNRDTLRKASVSIKAVDTRNKDLYIESADFKHDRTEVQLVLNRQIKRIYKIENFSESIIPIEKA